MVGNAAVTCKSDKHRLALKFRRLIQLTRSIFGARGKFSHRFVHPLPSPAALGDVCSDLREERNQRQIRRESACLGEAGNEAAQNVDDSPAKDALSCQGMR